MTKSELVEHLASASGLPKSSVNVVLAALVSSITSELQAGRAVGLPGLGQFDRQHRSARMARHLHTGAAISVAAKFTPRFRASKALKEAMPNPAS